MDSLYIVIELQRNGESMANIVTSHNTLPDAEYKFHIVAASAAISNVQRHTVLLVDDEGFEIEKVVFEHNE